MGGRSAGHGWFIGGLWVWRLNSQASSDRFADIVQGLGFRRALGDAAVNRRALGYEHAGFVGLKRHEKLYTSILLLKGDRPRIADLKCSRFPEASPVVCGIGTVVTLDTVTLLPGWLGLATVAGIIPRTSGVRVKWPSVLLAVQMKPAPEVTWNVVGSTTITEPVMFTCAFGSPPGPLRLLGQRLHGAIDRQARVRVGPRE